MSMKRTNVYADADDLAMVKEAAAQRGVSEAEILREGIRLAAMGARVWDSPLILDEETIDLGESIRADEISTSAYAAAANKAVRTQAHR